jgi:hypothetical protein
MKQGKARLMRLFFHVKEIFVVCRSGDRQKTKPLARSRQGLELDIGIAAA